MAKQLYQAEIKAVPHSSIVGSSLMVTLDGVGCVAILMISVPQPHLDYKMVAEAVAKALTTSGSYKGTLDLVLPDDFKQVAKAALAAQR